MKSKSDNKLLELFSGGGRAKIVILLLCGLLLVFIGGLDFGEKAETPDEDERVALICSQMSGVGDCRVMMTYYPDDKDRVYAVLVLCDGADSPKVRERITSLFTSLYGIGSNRVEIGKLVE